MVWLIAEHDAHDIPGALALTCLVFDSQTVCRRYWIFPADWLTFADAKLLDIMSQPRPMAS